MEQKLALQIIMYVSIAGLLFSGYLSYTELVMDTCPLGGCTYVLGAPACVYGFVMYLALLVISILGIKE